MSWTEIERRIHTARAKGHGQLCSCSKCCNAPLQVALSAIKEFESERTELRDLLREIWERSGAAPDLERRIEDALRRE